jgi:hypothetical protein
MLAAAPHQRTATLWHMPHVAKYLILMYLMLQDHHPAQHLTVSGVLPGCSHSVVASELQTGQHAAQATAAVNGNAFMK